MLTDAATQQLPKYKIIMSKNGILRHIVMLQLKDGISITESDAIANRFIQLQEQIEEIDSIEWGINNSSEGLDEGLTHCFTLTFASILDRDTYLIHSHHVAFAEWVKEWIEKVVVFDYCPSS